jgi:glycosyltransferase involved in cell wall biosynthesis
MKLCIFPNDPIKAYYEKGEIKTRYFNPKNFFDEIHIISLTDNDISELKVKTIAGNANLKIHSVGKVNLKNYKKEKERILSIVKKIEPDIIRSYNPLVEGWLAAYCAEKLNKPFLVSIHIQIDNQRKLFKKTNFKRFLALKFSEKIIEPYVLKKADKIVIVYKIIEEYVLKKVRKKPELLYNRIDIKQYKNGEKLDKFSEKLIISVGRLAKQKNHKCLIESMKKIDGHLLIIGNGELYNELTELIVKLGLQDKIEILKYVPNNEIKNYYKSAKIFALAYDPKLEGIPIPVIEAMAAGLPVVIPFPKPGYSDGLEDTAVFSKITPNSFSDKINSILENQELQREMKLKSLKKAKEYDNEIMEQRELDMYQELLKIEKFKKK